MKREIKTERAGEQKIERKKKNRPEKKRIEKLITKRKEKRDKEHTHKKEENVRAIFFRFFFFARESKERWVRTPDCCSEIAQRKH